MKYEKPTIMGMAEFLPSAKCPRCNLMMYLGPTCPHCECFLSHLEQERQKKFWINVRNKAYRRGFVFFIVAILFFYYLFSL